MKELKNKKEIDFNKLIKDIVHAATKDSVMYAYDSKPSTETTRMVTTLKLEVKVTKNLSQVDEAPGNSTKLVLQKINA